MAYFKAPARPARRSAFPVGRPSLFPKKAAPLGLPTSPQAAPFGGAPLGPAAPSYMPPVQPFDYPQSVPAAAPGAGPAPPGTNMSLKNDVMDFGEMPPGMQSQQASAQSAAAMGLASPNRLTEGTLDQVRGGKPASPFENTLVSPQGPPVAPGGAAAITPGALANTPGFDPRFMKPKAPVWR